MTIKRLLLNLLGLVVSLLVIWYGGRYISSLADRNYREGIDRHGMILKAVVTKKRYLKGRYVVFKYNFKDRQFSNKEQNRELYKSLLIGDSILIKMDTLNPEDSYIIDPEN